MVNLRKESNLGRSHGIVVGEEEFESEDAAYITLLDYTASMTPLRTFVRGLCGTVNGNIEIPKVILMRNRVNTRYPS